MPPLFMEKFKLDNCYTSWFFIKVIQLDLLMEYYF